MATQIICTVKHSWQAAITAHPAAQKSRIAAGRSRACAQNALYSRSTGTEDSLDGNTEFISGKEPFGYLSNTG